MDESDLCGCHLSLSFFSFFFFTFRCVCFYRVFERLLLLLLTVAVGIIYITYSCHCIFQVSLGCLALASVGDAAYCTLGTGCVNEPGHGS